MPKRKHKGGPEITFDPEARRSYLRGFSERKKQRRAYGLAMQKVKDRQEKLTERKERKESLMHQIEQSEKAKQKLLEGSLREREEFKDVQDDNDDDAASSHSDTQGDETKKTSAEDAPETKIHKYEDKETEKRWGGQVVVTTSTAIPDDDSDDDDDGARVAAQAKGQLHPRRRRGRKDEAQEYAGSVDRFLSKTIKALPGKQNKAQNHHRHKGKHGASEMKGVGGAAGLQAAQKFLKRSHDKNSKRDGKKKKRR